MTKKILTFIIVFIVFYEIYLLSTKFNVVNKKNTVINKDKEYVISPVNNDTIIKLEHDTIDEPINNTELVELVELVDPMMFGKPTEYEKDNIIVWTMLDPQPWTKVIYKYHVKYPFYFYIKIKIPSLNDYDNWKKIIPNLDFDPRIGEIIIQCDDEETALSIANLILSNFKGDLSMEEILNKNLIDISINKARKYQIVKNKLIEQIMANSNDKPSEAFNDTQTFKSDLATHKNDNINAYEGTEYSFF